MNVRKILIGALLSSTLLVMVAFTANAATYVGGNAINGIMTKTPTAISYGDISRLTEVATEATGKQANIVNAVRYNGSNTTWIVRLSYGSEYENAGDYVLTVLPYSVEVATGKVVSFPFKNVEEGTAMYGPSWFYFGVFDEVTHNICGFVLAERFRRWPDWNDKTFAGVTKRNIGYNGTYVEDSSIAFIDQHQELEKTINAK